MRFLGIERAHVVGHSASGCIALQMALDVPDVVHSLALLEPAAGSTKSAGFRRRSGSMPRAIRSRRSIPSCRAPAAHSTIATRWRAQFPRPSIRRWPTQIRSSVTNCPHCGSVLRTRRGETHHTTRARSGWREERCEVSAAAEAAAGMVTQRRAVPSCARRALRRSRRSRS